jgi:hypothetical protein
VGRRELVGIFCDPMLEGDIAERMERDVPGIDIWFSECDGVIEAAREAADYDAVALVVVDGTPEATDADVIEAAKALSATSTKMIFSSSTFARSWPAKIGAALVDTGCVDLAVATGAESRGWLDALIDAISGPVGPDEAEALCLRPKAVKSHAPVDGKPAASSTSRRVARRKVASAFPSVAEPSEFAMSKHVGICQCVAREGSTHLAIAISRVLTMAGKRVACVVPKRHVANLRRMFNQAPYDVDLGRIEVSGITFFEGDLPSAVPTPTTAADDFDVVVTDFDSIDWYGASDTPARMEYMERRRQAFTHADVRILSSFLDPAGAWNVSGKFFPAIPRGDLKKMTLAVHGLSDLSLEDHYRKELAAAGLDPGKLVVVEYMPLPIVARTLTEACPGIVRLAGEALPAKGRAALAAQVETDEEGVALAAQSECLRLLCDADLSTDTSRLAKVRTHRQATELVEQVALEAARARGADVADAREEALRELVAQIAGEPVEDWEEPGAARMLLVARALDERYMWEPLAIEAARSMTDEAAREAAKRIAAGKGWNDETEPVRRRGIWPIGRGRR